MLENIKIFIYKQESRIPWVDEFKKLYYEELSKLPFVQVEYTHTVSHKKGYLLLAHITELEYFREREYETHEVRTIMQMNGTSLLRYNRHIDPRQELQDLSDVDINITASDRLTKLAKGKFKLDNIHTIGFPVRIVQETFEKEKGLYCIGGKLDPGKMVHLSIKMALHSEDFERLVICYPFSSRDLQKYYPTHPKIEYRCCNHEQFLEHLKKAETWVVSSLEDTTNISTVEAIRYGCRIIAVDWGEMLPYHNTNEAEIDKFDPEVCAVNLLETILQYETENEKVVS